MAWIRLDDDYIYHPKFTALSHVAFRLWHEGMAYCRKTLSDGAIPRAALRTFKYATRSAVIELATAVGKLAPLWETDGDGFLVHDYLDWNAGHQEERGDREAAKKRMRAYRGRVLPDVTPLVTLNVTPPVTPSVPGEGKGKDRSSEKERERKPASSLESEDVSLRAGRFVERFAELYAQERHGARYRQRPNLDWSEACDLVKLWPDERLEKLAIWFLNSADPFIAGTDRGFHIFVLKASFCDNELTAWEQQRKASA